MLDRSQIRKGFFNFLTPFTVGLSVGISALLGSPNTARAQTTPKPFSLESAGGDFRLTLGGWVDAYFGYNFNEPASNKDTVRAFDYRHNSFALQVVALDVGFEGRGGVLDGTTIGRLTLQAGDEPDAYYLASGSENAADAQPNYDH